MYFSRATVNPGAIFSPEFQKIATGPYQVHSMLWDIFSDSKERKRDFVYRVDISEGKPKIYFVSKREPVYNGNFWYIETKSYNPVISDGQYLAFSLRANPVVTKTIPASPGNEKKRIRHDVVMDAKRRIKEENGDYAKLLSMNDIVQQEGFRWLSSRSEKNGFEISEGNVRCDGYSQMNFMQGKKNRKVSLSSIDFDGILKVTDANKFLEILGNGIGPAKGFGCGLMLVKAL